MNKFIRRFKLTFILLFLIPASAVTALEKKGDVDIYVFSASGMPQPGVEVTVNEETFTTDENGYLTFRDLEGTREYELFYKGRKAAVITIPVRAGLVMEALITVSDNETVVFNETENSSGNGESDSSEKKTGGFTGKTGILSGIVRDIEKGEIIKKATVIFKGIAFESNTGDTGRFIAEVPEGEYSISIIHPDFSSRTIDGIKITADEKQDIEVSLTPSAITIEAVTVFASDDIRVKGGIADLLDETKNSSVVMNLIGAEQISHSGDSDAAGALSRVTGLTVVDGKYVYIRGMGERYSSSYLNGARLPSPEIDKRVVPLDLFPTSVIESMSIQKSFSPDLFGDFAGGTVSLRTSGIPEDRYKRRLRTTYNFSIGYDADSTFTEQMVDTAGVFDWLGFDDGDRELSELIHDEQVTESSSIFSADYTEEEIETIAESLPQDWDGTTGIIWPDISASVSFRDKVEFEDDASLGWNLSLSYKNDWDTSAYSIKNYSDVSQEAIYYDYDAVSTSRNIDIGALYDMGYKVNDNLNFESTTLLVRTTDNEIENYSGYFSSDSLDLNVFNISWIESTLISQRIAGMAGFDFLTEPDLNWQYTFSMANRYEPGTSEIIYAKNADDESSEYSVYPRSNAASQCYATVNDMIHDAKLELEIPFFFLGNDSADYFDVGTQFMYQTREADVRRFAFGPSDDTAIDLSLSPDELFIEEYINEEFNFAEYTEKTDNYRGSHLIAAGYFNTDLLLFNYLRTNAGLRAEYSKQDVETYYLFGDTESAAELQVLDILPALNLTLPLGERFQFRTSGSKTVNRPDLRELSDAPKYDVAGSGVFKGNPDLQEAKIWNADTRLEYYIAEQESLSIGGFYKHFTDAIEIVSIAGAADSTTLANVPSAYNIGGELEWQLSLRYISDGIRSYISRARPPKEIRKALAGTASLFRDMNTSGNFSYIYSMIDYEGEQGTNTNAQRALQGQSPWILNVSFGYKNAVSWSMDYDSHTSIYLNYNVFGPRISRIGKDGSPDYYEQPFHQLDLVAKHSFNEFFSMGFKFKNILDLPATETVGDLIVNEEKKGRSFTVSGKLDF